MITSGIDALYDSLQSGITYSIDGRYVIVSYITGKKTVYDCGGNLPYPVNGRLPSKLQHGLIMRVLSGIADGSITDYMLSPLYITEHYTAPKRARSMSATKIGLLAAPILLASSTILASAKHCK